MEPTKIIIIQHEQFGVLLNESFQDNVQFTLFLKMVHGSLTLKEDLDFFNGIDFLIHIPYKLLNESVIFTKVNDYSLSDHMKSKIEALVVR